ncbi:MAG: DHH family phosphoesterase [Corallococcus sp.]|nr:DHH family phosphoesterase [Corallococcus sp.]MCM1359443.1 DHH family phosphoesterase [Corallococcus sp.]MCM1394745.1 DHH family phosphoesterase [Corallococcus sp.]
MKERYVKRKINNSESVKFFVNKGMPENLAETLSARGVTEQNYSAFFGEDCFHSPFLMKNMSEAVETISFILENGGSILIYGDYDADGLTASSMLSLFFTDNGVDNDVIVPTREQGYGLHSDLVMAAFEKKFYDLIITVDCGISNREEIATIVEELDAEIIVTDHHELPELLPDCLCVNPKMGYPFANLAGAGVAWKLIEALVGREVAAKYSEFAMLGTIGDVMEMSDENRSIVKLGLANRNHKSLLKLAELSKCSKQLTASDVAMKITPKINAAGRMGEPQIALDMLLSRDNTNLAVVNKILELNEARKQTVDALENEAALQCDGEQISKRRLVFLYGENWPHGLLGIIAARFKEKYNYPALAITKNEDGICVGSARGVDGADLFDLFCQCKDLLIKFGGHKASVGFSVAEENLNALRERLAALLLQTDSDVFHKNLYYDIDLNDGVKVSEMYEFTQKLQPFLPQDKVVFKVRDAVKFSGTFGKGNVHLSATLASGLELKGFYRAKYAPFIKNGADVEALITLEMDEYSHNVCGFIEDIHLCNSVCFDEFYKLNFLQNFGMQSVRTVSINQAKDLLAGNSVLAIFDDAETYIEACEIFPLDDYCVDFFFDDGAADNTVVISPFADYGFDKFHTVVCFCKQGMYRILPQRAVYVPITPAKEELYQLDLDRSVCASVYSALKRKSPFDSVKGIYDKYLIGKMNYAQYLVALRVFQELKFVEIPDKYTVKFLPAEKSDLTNSDLFRCFQKQ